MLFLSTWSLYCRLYHRPFTAPWGYTLSRLSQAAIATARTYQQMVEPLFSDYRVILWYGLLFLILFGLALITLFRERRLPGFILWILGGMALPCLLMGGSTEYSLPRYFYGLLPLMTYVIAVWIGPILAHHPSRYTKSIGWLILAGAALHWFLGDVHYQIEQTLKQRLLAETSVKLLALTIGGKLFLPIGLALGIGWTLKRNGWGTAAIPLCLLSGLIGHHLAVDLRHALVPYNTSTAYGVAGTKETVHFLNQLHLHSNQRVLMTRDLLYWSDIPEKNYYSVDARIWFDTDQFLHALPSADVIIYGFGLQGLHQYRKIFHHPAVRTALAAEFINHPIGSYDLWTRKGLNPR